MIKTQRKEIFEPTPRCADEERWREDAVDGCFEVDDEIGSLLGTMRKINKTLLYGAGAGDGYSWRGKAALNELLQNAVSEESSTLASFSMLLASAAYRGTETDGKSMLAHGPWRRMRRD